MIDDLKEAKAHYIIGPTVGGKSKLEVEDKRYDAPAILERAGVEFTPTTDSMRDPHGGLLIPGGCADKTWTHRGNGL